jgi:SHS2 domain-containing protein/predicted heme/steroid binding protein
VRFTRRTLSRFNGIDGMPAYIAFKGRVYDVTESPLWRNGEHQVVHEAGRDLTRELDKAPHGKEMLEKFPAVGEFLEYEEIEHTADAGIRAYGETIEELFENCAYGMYSIMVEKYDVLREGERSFALESISLEGLLVKWLSELLFYFETESLIFSDFNLKVSGKKLSAKASFCHYDEGTHGYATLIKAVTYHMLEIRKEKGFYAVEIIFDV